MFSRTAISMSTCSDLQIKEFRPELIPIRGLSTHLEVERTIDLILLCSIDGCCNEVVISGKKRNIIEPALTKIRRHA